MSNILPKEIVAEIKKQANIKQTRYLSMYQITNNIRKLFKKDDLSIMTVKKYVLTFRK